MKRLTRQPGQIETLNFHAAVDVPARGEQRLVSDPARVEATVSLFEAGLRDSLDTPTRIRGWVSDQLFGLVAADLSGCRMVKQEDTGVLFYEDDVKLPDWRLTLLSGATVFVEVKSVLDDFPRVAKLRMSEVARLERYAELSGTPLYLAVHWVALSLWTLVPVDDLTRVGDHLEVDLETALKRDHMCLLLNDRLLGLVPPLEFRMTLEEDASGDVAPSSASDPKEETTQVSLVVMDVRLFAGGQEMLDEREKALVWFLIQHAKWPIEEAMQNLGDGVWELVFIMAPEEIPEEQDFAFVGRLSELYTRMFYSGTTSLDEEGHTQLTVDVEPGTLPRLVPTDLHSKRLPLWHVNLHPTENAPAGDGLTE